MSSPSALLVSRYRAFDTDAVLPLRPITLVFGRNNSGKSALCRAIAMLGASVAKDAPSALVIPPEVLREGKFTDLAWQGEAGNYSFDLGLRWPDGDACDVRYTLNGGGGRPTYVKELELRDAQHKLLWSGQAPPHRPMRPQGTHEGEDLEFVGLVPKPSGVVLLQELATRMERLRGRFRWLEGIRARPERDIKRTGSPPSQLTSNGSNAAHFLVERPELADELRRFYSKLKPARDLEIREVLDVGHQITLNPSTQTSFRIDLVDTGEGMAQVLPVLVAATLAAKEGEGSVLAVEEPESHLHPDAQSELARYLCDLAAGTSPPTLVLETHSRVFLLGVQLAVAEGRLPPDRISLAWVDQDATGRSTITPVELSRSGHPMAGWPPAALAEDLNLASQLARLGLAQAT